MLEAHVLLTRNDNITCVSSQHALISDRYGQHFWSLRQKTHLRSVVYHISGANVRQAPNPANNIMGAMLEE